MLLALIAEPNILFALEFLPMLPLNSQSMYLEEMKVASFSRRLGKNLIAVSILFEK
jgi:hypothetical protein